MRYSHFPPSSAPPPKRSGFLRLLKYIIIAALLGSIFRLIPAVGVFSSASNIGMFGGSSNNPYDNGMGGGWGYEQGFNTGLGGIGSSNNAMYGSRIGGSDTARPEIDATPLIKAAIKGDGKEVEKLLQENIPINGRDSDQRTALMGAAYYGQNAVCVRLLAAGANIGLKDHKGYNALDFAAARGLVETVKLLLKHSNYTDKKHHVEYAMLMQAAFAGDTRLLPKGKNKLPSISNFSPEGKSPLHVAASGGSVDMVRELIMRGAKVNLATVEGRTPLHWAAWSNKPFIISLLLENGAAIDADDVSGITPLMLAAKQGNRETVMLLIEKGADKDLFNKKGENAAAIADNQGFVEIASILKADR